MPDNNPGLLTALAPVQAGLDVTAQAGQSAQSGMDAYRTYVDGIRGAQALPMNGAAQSPGLGFAGGLGMVSGGLTVANGVSEIMQGQTSQGAYDMLSGAASFGQGATAALTPMVSATSRLGSALGPVGGALGVFSGGLQMGRGITEVTTPGRGGDGAFDLLQGGLNATAGAATVVGAAPVAAVAGAGAAGMSAGRMLADWTERDSHGNFGRDASTGRERSAFDAAADDGIAAHGWITQHLGGRAGDDGVADTVGNVAGAATAGVMGIGNTIANLGIDAYRGVSSLF